jgi:hypothetical protein
MTVEYRRLLADLAVPPVPAAAMPAMTGVVAART